MKIGAPLLLLLGAAPALARPGAPTSTYTRVDLDRCKVEEHEEEGSYYLWRCAGYAGVPLYVEVGDERFDVDAGDSEDEDSRFAANFDSPPDVVEWRLAGRRPFAIIYRLTSANPDLPQTSTVVVETIGTGSRPGCRVAELPGSTPSVNQAARRAADRLLTGKPACLHR